MQFVVCDDDQLFASMVEAMLTDLGHVVVGVGSNTADSVALVQSARPDVVIVDLSLGFSDDFDVVDTASDLGAFPIVFSRNVDYTALRRYKIRPIVVFKPDLPELERVVRRLELDSRRRVVQAERRERPAYVAVGPAPGLSDAQAFYEALNGTTAGDALLSIEVPGDGPVAAFAADAVRRVMREADQMLATSSVLRVFLTGAAGVGVGSFIARLDKARALPAGATLRSVVVAADESPTLAFDRLKATEPTIYTPKMERSPAVAPPSTDHSAPVT